VKKRVFLIALCMMLLTSMVLAPISASASVVRIMKVNVNGARLRTGPGESSILKPSLKKGERVFYWGKHANAFYYVRTSTGRVGYVYKRYLTSYGAVNSSQIYYAAGKVNVYKKTSTGARRVTKLSNRQHVIVYEARGGWAYIKTLSGKGGYVKMSSLRKAK